MRTYAILGATGHIGQIVTEELLKKGHRVRAIGRDSFKLEKLKAKGAEIISCSFDDAEAMSKAFKGCDAVFSFTPPFYVSENMEEDQDKVGEAIKNALTQTKVPHVVNLSSIGAQLAEGTGPIKGLSREEKRLNSIPNLNVLHLRAGFFMENLLQSAHSIKDGGVNRALLRPDLPLAMVATVDIGRKAAEFLDSLNFQGQSVFEFIGPREVTMEEATAIIGKVIGKPDLKYIQFSPEEGEKALISSGMKPKTAKLLVEMIVSFNKGAIPLTQVITPEHRGTTTFEEFARIFESMRIKRAA